MSEDPILDILETTQNPFQWGLLQLYDSDVCEANKKVSTPKEVDDGIKYQNDYMKFCAYLLSATRRSMYGYLGEAREKLAKCEEIMSYNVRVMVTYRPAFQHVLYTTRAHLALMSHDIQEAKKLIEKVPRFESLDEAQQAAVWGTRANVTLRCHTRDTRDSFQYAKKALELCPSEPEWHHLMGILMSRDRHRKFPRPSPTEIELYHFQLAFKMEETADIAVLLAGAYADLSIYHRDNSDSVDDQEIAQNYVRKAYDMYMYAVYLNNEFSPDVMIRCARGLTRLPNRSRLWSLAIDLMYKALKKAPNNTLVTHYSGLICNINKKFEEARKYLRASLDGGLLKAAFTLIQVEMKLEPTFSADNFFNQLLEDFPSSSDQAKIFLNASLYHLFKEKKFTSAVVSFTKALQIYPANEEMKTIWPMWVHWKQINLIELFANDIQFELKFNGRHYSDKELGDMKRLLELLVKVEPDKVSTEVTKSMLDEILTSAVSF